MKQNDTISLNEQISTNTGENISVRRKGYCLTNGSDICLFPATVRTK